MTEANQGDMIIKLIKKASGKEVVGKPKSLTENGGNLGLFQVTLAPLIIHIKRLFTIW